MYLFAGFTVPTPQRFDWRELKLAGGKAASLTGLASAKLVSQLFLILADSANNVLSSFYLQNQSNRLVATQLGATIMRPDEWIKDVVFSEGTNKLYVATWNNRTQAVVVHTYNLESIQSMDTEGIQIGHYSLVERITLRVLKDGTFLCGVWYTTKVHVCSASNYQNDCSVAARRQ